MPDSIIKADNISSLSGGGVGFPDGSVSNPSMKFTNDSDTGIYRPNNNELGFVTSGSEKLRIEATGQIKSVYESTVGTDYNTTLHNGYFCRAWINFDGTGTVAIRASGNVSSITDNGTGRYTINFTTAMPDANYSVNLSWQSRAGSNDYSVYIFNDVPSATVTTTTPTTSSFTILCNGFDPAYTCIGVFR